MDPLRQPPRWEHHACVEQGREIAVPALVRDPAGNDRHSGIGGEVVCKSPELRLNIGLHGIHEKRSRSRFAAGDKPPQRCRHTAKICSVQFVIVSAAVLPKRHRIGGK